MTNPPTNHGGGGGGTSPGRAPGGPGRSVYQQSYRSPQGLTDYDRRMPTTRFGSTLNRAAAAGVGTFVDCIFAGINSGGGGLLFFYTYARDCRDKFFGVGTFACCAFAQKFRRNECVFMPGL